MIGFFIFLVMAALYFLPSVAAYGRKHKNCASIMVINLFLGWTLLGWVVALAWALTDNTKV